MSNVPADTQLLEIFQTNGRKEVKSLVARSSIHVGLFVPFIRCARDSEQKANWKMHIDALRAAMARARSRLQGETRARGSARKPAAKDLYEMLCGYSADQVGKTPEQLKAGMVVAQLIDWLEQDSLDYRVLAARTYGRSRASDTCPTPRRRWRSGRETSNTVRAQFEKGELKPVTPPQ